MNTLNTQTYLIRLTILNHLHTDRSAHVNNDKTKNTSAPRRNDEESPRVKPPPPHPMPEEERKRAERKTNIVVATASRMTD
jgi:hypothetical protein